MLFTSNPFERLLPAAADGRDLNPLLQDPGHGDPPADALHGLRRLLGGVRVRASPRCSAAGSTPPGRAGRGRGRRWPGRSSPSASRWAAAGPTTSWAGAAGGSGIRWRTPPSCRGWSGTALMHSLAVTEKRGGFKIWTVLLAIIAFSLSLLGTFLVRSGRADLGARLRHRSRARHLHPRLPGGRDRRLARAVRLARAEGRAGRAVRTGVARIAAARQQRAAAGRRRGGACWARSTRCSSTRWAWARSRSVRPTSRRCSCR